MPVPSDFLLPSGELPESWFPDGEATNYLDAFISAAESASTDEAAQTAFVYARAYRMRCNDLSSNPASVDLDDQGSYRLLSQQIKNICDRAVEWAAQFENLTGGQATGTAADSKDVSVSTRWV